MPMPATEKQVVDEILATYCDRKAPPQVRNEVRLVHQWRGTKVTLLEQRPHWRDPKLWGENPVAQFRFDPERVAWTLHWRDRNERWRPYEAHPTSASLPRLLVEVDQDPTGIFWG